MSGQAFGMPTPLLHAAILILAAGQSRRMRGADKMLELVDGQPLIRRQVQMAIAAGLPVWVALPPDRPLRVAAIADLAVRQLPVQDADLGISKSIIAGNAAIPAGYDLLLWLADLPEIETSDLKAILFAAKAAPNAIVRATTGAGKPGHPVYFPASMRGELARLTGDDGARDVLKRHLAATVFVPLPDERALTDLDTPEDWANWRAGRRP